MATSSSNMAWRDPATLQKYGQEQYQLGKLSSALEAFNQALRLNLPDTVGILDNRAATFLKLGQLERALQDGRKMIRMDGLDGRGYLRCGKVLQMMGKPDKALELYTYGLQVLPADLPVRNLIVQLKDKLKKRMESPKGVDPFVILPPEIAGMILEYFNFRQIVAILRVSRQWQTYLSSLPKLWTHLDLSIPQTRGSTPSRKPITISAMRSYTRKSRSGLTHATLSNISRTSTLKALENVSRYPRLSHLDIQLDILGIDLFEVFHTSTNLMTLIISPITKVSSNVLLKFVHNCPHLERLESYAVPLQGIADRSWPDKMPNLRTLTLVTENSDRPFQHQRDILHPLAVPGISNGKLSERLPNLEELRLTHLQFGLVYLKIRLSLLSNFRLLVLKEIHLRDFPELPSSLEHLYISGAQMLLDPISQVPDDSDISLKLPNLKSLALVGAKFVTLEFLKKMFTETEMEPTSVNLSGCTKLDGGDIYQLILTGHLEPVEEFDISSLANITDHLAPVIIKHMPNLKVLNLNRTQVTGVLVKDLVDAPSLGIEKLLVEECGNLSADAIKYARGRGVDVVSVVRG